MRRRVIWAVETCSRRGVGSTTNSPSPFGYGGAGLAFDTLVWNPEKFLATGQSPYPVERTLLTSSLLDLAVHSRKEKGRAAGGGVSAHPLSGSRGHRLRAGPHHAGSVSAALRGVQAYGQPSSRSSEVAAIARSIDHCRLTTHVQIAADRTSGSMISYGVDISLLLHAHRQTNSRMLEMNTLCRTGLLRVPTPRVSARTI